MSKVIKATFKDNWGGGAWIDTLTGESFSCKDLPKVFQVKFNNKPVIDGKAVKITGSDYDHGKSYYWVGTDILFKLNTEVGVIWYSARNYLKEHPKVKSFTISFES